MKLMIDKVTTEDLVFSADSGRGEFSAIAVNGLLVPRCVSARLWSDSTLIARCYVMRNGEEYMDGDQIAECVVIGRPGEIIKSPFWGKRWGDDYQQEEMDSWLSQFERWPESLFEVPAGSLIWLGSLA